MDKKTSRSREKVRQQFNSGPYPRRPLEKFPKDDYNWLFTHSAIAPYYLRNKEVIDSQGLSILDAGCGTGYKALALAAANPGANIVGIDISEESIELAKKRLDYYGFKQAEFYVMALEEVPNLGQKFDYINCDEVLYFLPNLVSGMQALGMVLKPDGILRGNLHSALQRNYFYRVQKGLGLIGLMDGNPREPEIELCREIMGELKNDVRVKRKTWDRDRAYKDEGWILSNYLLLEDRGYTIPELFAALRESELELVSMVKWQNWEFLDLFQKGDRIPDLVKKRLSEMSLEQRLHLFELWNPIYRLLDFWCGHPQDSQGLISVKDWSQQDWENAIVQLHPQLNILPVKKDAIICIAERIPFKISQYITIASPSSIAIDPIITTCMLPLWDKPQSMSDLVERYLKIAPTNPFTLKPTTKTKALQELAKTFKKLESCFYLFLERSP